MRGEGWAHHVSVVRTLVSLIVRTLPRCFEPDGSHQRVLLGLYCSACYIENRLKEASWELIRIIREGDAGGLDESDSGKGGPSCRRKFESSVYRGHLKL